MRVRIVTNGESYRVQERRGWRWHDLRVPAPGRYRGPHPMIPATFPTIEQARGFLRHHAAEQAHAEELRARGRRLSKWRPVG